MNSLSFFGRLLERRARYKGYQAMRMELDSLSEADLADIGAKRYQMGHVARVKALSAAIKSLTNFSLASLLA